MGSKSTNRPDRINKTRPQTSGNRRTRDTGTKISEDGGKLKRTRQGKGSSGRRKKKRTSAFYKAVSLIFIAIIIVIGGIFIRNFGAGSKAFRQGMETYENGDYARAVNCFKQATQHDGNNMTYMTQLGMAQIKNAAYDEAIETFTAMKNKAHSDTDRQSALRGIGIAYLYKGNYSNAVSALSDAMSYAGKKYTDQEIDILFYLAEAQDKNGDPVEAVLTYTKILNQKSSANGYMLRGGAYQKVGDNTNAEADLYKAIELSGKEYKVYMMLYQVLTAEGKSKEAEDVLEEAATLPAKTSEDYSNRGLIYMYMKEYEQADADFEKAIEMQYMPAYFGKACLLMAQGNYEDAVESFKTYFEQVQDNALAYNQYGVCLMGLGKYEDAADAFSKGLALNDRTVDQELMFNEFTAYERMGQWAEAYTKVMAYVEKYPDDEQAKQELTFIESRQK